ncbi:MAG: hypothetical protein Q4P34_02920 [Tissierellia bacterium]|nr:hypothetical protein [Tissierellia bacterium]
MFIYIFALIWAYLIIKILGKYMHKNQKVTYIISLLFSIAILLLPYDLENVNPLFFSILLGPFTTGAIPMAIFFFVMWGRILPKRWSVTKIIMQNRAELSILGCFLSFSHNIFMGFIHEGSPFIEFFTKGIDMGTGFYIATFITLILDILLIPLFITSFQTVRRKMKAKTWKNIQRLAYPFWILLHFHVLTIWGMGFLWHVNEQDLGIEFAHQVFMMLFYIITLCLYIGLRLQKYSFDKDKRLAKSTIV